MNMSLSYFIIPILLLGSASSLSIQSPTNEVISRRKAFVTGAATFVAATSATFVPKNNIAQAVDVDVPDDDPSFPQERTNLLKKVSQRASDEEVAEAISKLELLDPSRGTAATSEQLGGQWELIYSVNAEAFSPLLNLPKPIRPTSQQLIGDAATPVVGEGRIAQLLNFPILPLSFILSSGAVPYEKDSSVLEIFPPFRFDVKFGGARKQVVESGSDADFRALNSRTEEAQAAGRNLYKQRYLETTGRKGDIRISEVIAGDPVLVGEVFIHRRI
jgi:hypothetical protein